MLFTFAAIALVIGCTKSGLPDTARVTGKVTYKGQPVDGATVSFIGDGNTRPATAVTGADGSYELRTLDTEGAMAGSYTVLVDKTDMPAELTQEVSMEDAAENANKPLPQPKKLLPAKYGDRAQSPLKFEVKDGADNNFDLELTD